VGLRRDFPELSVPPPENLHVTLAFLGELDAEAAGRAAEAVRKTAAAVQPATVEWGRPGAFPSLARARVVWLGLAGVEEVTATQVRLVGELRAHELPAEERKFRPHLTLARVRSGLSRETTDRLAERLAAIPAPPAAVAESLVLYSSRLGRGPAVYEPLVTATL
jgi:2'-5' RNA ligase